MVEVQRRLDRRRPSCRTPGRRRSASTGGARRRRRRDGARPRPDRHDLGQDRQRDLLGRARADVEPGRRVDARPLLGREVERVEHRRRRAGGARPARRRARRRRARRAAPALLVVPCEATTTASASGGTRRPSRTGRAHRVARAARASPASARAIGALAVHDDQRRGHDRLEEDLERPARQARVVHDDGPGLGRLGASAARRVGRDPQQHRLARCPARPAPAPARSPPRTRRRRTRRSCRRRARAPSSPGFADVGFSARTTVARDVRLPRRRRSSASSLRSSVARSASARRRSTATTCQFTRSPGRSGTALPCMARHTCAGVSGMSACRTWIGVEHGVDHRGGRADRRRLPHALHAERVVRATA